MSPESRSWFEGAPTRMSERGTQFRGIDPEGARSVKTMDSAVLAEEVARGGTLRFYLRTLRSDPGKIVIGATESILEIARFVVRPRFPLSLTCMERARLIKRWIIGELKIPGGTTALETIWLAYGAAMSTSKAT